MDTIKKETEILTASKTPKVETALRLYFNCPPKLYSRIVSYTKTKGFKDSTLILVSIDEYLNKNNF